MKWIFVTTQKWFNDGTHPCQCIYLRPYYIDESGDEYAGKIIDMEVVAIPYLIEKKAITRDTAEYLFRIYETELINKDYYLHFEIEDRFDTEIYMNCGHLYVHDNYNKQQLINWLKLYLAVLGYPCTEMTESDILHFPETNEILSMFTVENLKKMEYRLGKEWWLPENKRKKSKTTHKSNIDLINKLIKEIKESKN